jgi:prophage regulatory protein
MRPSIKPDLTPYTTMLRQPEVSKLTGLDRQSIYIGIKGGTFPPPVKIARQTVAWPDHEVEAINKARIAGLSRAEIEGLVVRIQSARHSIVLPI